MLHFDVALAENLFWNRQQRILLPERVISMKKWDNSVNWTVKRWNDFFLQSPSTRFAQAPKFIFQLKMWRSNQTIAEGTGSFRAWKDTLNKSFPWKIAGILVITYDKEKEKKPNRSRWQKIAENEVKSSFSQLDHNEDWISRTKVLYLLLFRLVIIQKYSTQAASPSLKIIS